MQNMWLRWCYHDCRRVAGTPSGGCLLSPECRVVFKFNMDTFPENKQQTLLKVGRAPQDISSSNPWFSGGFAVSFKERNQKQTHCSHENHQKIQVFCACWNSLFWVPKKVLQSKITTWIHLRQWRTWTNTLCGHKLKDRILIYIIPLYPLIGGHLTIERWLFVG